MTFTATVGLDNYYMQYEVKVGAYNIHGDGPNSSVKVIYSAEGSELLSSLFSTNSRMTHFIFIIAMLLLRVDA